MGNAKVHVHYFYKHITVLNYLYIFYVSNSYGDFKPSQILSRIAAVIYIMIGLVMSSLLVGSIVTAITTVNDSAEVKIYGRKVCLHCQSYISWHLIQSLSLVINIVCNKINRLLKKFFFFFR